MQKPKDIAKSVKRLAKSNFSLFDSTLTTRLTGLRVFDVGQGDCFGLLNQNGEVFCYVDYGGLGNHPDQGSRLKNPAGSRMPVAYGSGYTAIILTHWDKDHYYSAKKYNDEAKKGLWLVPRQLASPQAVRFAAGLPNALRWPESWGQKVKTFRVNSNDHIEIRKCEKFVGSAKTEDRNATGLVVTLSKFKNRTLQFYSLLPGDRHFDGIPALPSAEIRVLIAYHHGSDTDWKPATKREITNLLGTPRDLVYSYGSSNTFGHPVTINYKTEWHPPTVRTPRLRTRKKKFEDFTW
jgi:hypothetical protein